MTERPWPTPPADLFDLTGKTALVSGGCGLLGKTFCRALATYGASVAIIDLARAEPVRAASELSEVSGVNTFGVACDVSLPEDVVSAVRQVEEELGVVDVLVNNAAAKPADMGEWVRPAEDFSLSVWREIMSVNMDGLFALSRTVGNSMIKGERSGSIIHISSVYGTIAPNPDILLLDEPFISIDKKVSNLLRKLLVTLWKKYKPIIVFVTHDLDEAIELADRICFLSNLPSKILLDYEVNLKRPRNQDSKNFITLKRLLSSTTSLKRR